VRSDKDAYRDYVEKCIELNSKISRQVEQGIRKLLLPHQLNQLQLSIGEGQAGEMGIVHLLTAGLLGDDLKLSDKDTKILWDFVSKRNELENRKMKDLESAILAELTPEQREQFKADLGELPGFLPTLFLTN
jgi:hypothetical protein